LLTQLADTIRSAGGRAHALELDVEQSEDAFQQLKDLDERVGGVDLVVANAGLAGAPAAIPFSLAPFENTSQILRTNLLGAAATLSAFVPGMVARGHGHLVAISSLAARCPNPRTPVYGAAKAGLSYLVESMDVELRPQGIAVTLVEPGFIRTPAAEEITDPMPFLWETSTAVDVIDDAIQRRARVVRFPWQTSWLVRAAASLPAVIGAPAIRWATTARSAPR
jgi:NAD(P)-dependent dehydrogenase (short-subunit alcohol dehydrogenase family)